MGPSHSKPNGPAPQPTGDELLTRCPPRSKTLNNQFWTFSGHGKEHRQSWFPHGRDGDGMAGHLLEGKVVLVTGGGEGIGAAAARRLAMGGADVAISYLHCAQPATDMVAELTVLGVHAVAVKADQADPNDVIGMVHDVARHFGHIDVLVNNAGIVQG